MSYNFLKYIIYSCICFIIIVLLYTKTRNCFSFFIFKIHIVEIFIVFLISFLSIKIVMLFELFIIKS